MSVCALGGLREPLCSSVSLPSSITQELARCTFVKFKRKEQQYPHPEMLRALPGTSTSSIGETDILQAMKFFQITLGRVIQSDYDQYDTKGAFKIISAILFNHIAFEFYVILQ